MTKLTASEYVKARGLPSVAYVAGKINEHPQRLFEWYNDNFAKFEAVVAGVKRCNVAYDPPIDWKEWYDRVLSERNEAVKALKDIRDSLVGPKVVPVIERRTVILSIIKEILEKIEWNI